MRLIVGRLSVMLTVCLLCGCGGGAGSHLTYVKATIDWGARSRNLSAPSSALSATFSLIGAKPEGGDVVFTVNRRSDPAAYRQSYTSLNIAKVGKWTLHVKFYAL